MSPSAVCPIPTAHSYTDVKSAYDNAKKKMPGLTPAAWRKQAAIDLGIDYNTFLAIWKAGKTAKKVVPASTPTVPAAASQTVSMGMKVAPKLPSGPATAKAAKAAPKTSPYFKPFKNNKGAQEAISEVSQQYKKGLMTTSEYGQALDDIASIAESLGFANWQVAKGLVEGMKINAGIFKKVAAVSKKTVSAAKVADTPAPVPGLVQTAHGPLDNALAKAAYQKMKKDMPGASPAQLRHAAAEYLGVDYNDYLKAWKMKPGKAASSPKLPSTPTTQPHVSPSPAGKYNNSDISADQLKDELAKLYGPGADKNYIAVVYNSTSNSWTVQLPKSLLPNITAKKAVADGLKALGLEVEPQLNYLSLIIRSKKAAQAAKCNAAQIKKTGTYTMPDGVVALDEGYANKWVDSWYPKIGMDAKRGWGSYTGGGYRPINEYWRKGTTNYGYTAQEIRKMSEAISKSMPKTSAEFTVWRGSGHIPLSQFKVGGKWTEDGFMSTAITPGAAWSGVRLEVVCPPGTRGMYIGSKSSSGNEREFLIDKGTSFRVISVDKAKNVVRLVAIPKK